MKQLEVLLVTSRRKGRWVLPKGKRKRWMKPHISAAHEAFEEAGVLGMIEPEPAGVYRQQKVCGEFAREIIIHAFPMLVNTQLRNWPEKAIRKRRWMSIEEAVQAVRDLELAQLLQAFATAHYRTDPEN
ncbi:8-oxo-dGTP pyrophosphatase MutT (NUDIX family) [Sphingomonas zeicaulis]